MRNYTKLAIQEYGYNCQRCGSSKDIGTHHKNGNIFDNRPENLLRCCRRCHPTIHTIPNRSKDYYHPVSEDLKSNQLIIDLIGKKRIFSKKFEEKILNKVNRRNRC